MKLSPPPRQKVPVYELARELGWTSRQLLAELSRRGEFVKSAASQLEAPIVRAIRQEFGAVGERPDPEATVAPAMYGRSTESLAEDVTGFAEALAKAKAQSKAKGQKKGAQWRPPVLQVLLDEVIVPQRPDHLDAPAGGYFTREMKKAAKLNQRWAEARLNGLGGDDALVIKWIRLSDGQRPELATDLAVAALLRTRRDSTSDTAVESTRDCRVSTSAFAGDVSIDRKRSRLCGSGASAVRQVDPVSKRSLIFAHSPISRADICYFPWLPEVCVGDFRA